MSSTSSGAAAVPAARCRLCGGDTRLAYVASDRNRRISDLRFLYRRCVVCGVLFLDDVPADLSPYYPDSYYPLQPSVDALRAATRFEEYKLDFVHLTHRSGRLLEIGPGAGGFALLASEAGFSVSVVEMPGPSTDWIRDRLDVSVHVSDNPVELVPSLGSFDVVALWHSWEHLRDPWRALDLVAAALSPGGTVIIATPNPTSLQLRLLGARWTHLDAPRHLVLSPPSTLALAAAQRGLRLHRLDVSDRSARGWNRFGWEESLAHLSHNELVASSLHRCGTVVARLLRGTETQANRASTYTLVVRRDSE
jgi:2-polyprenyl-3-methyl-5-hydroxy-6-metoxy-1,4-benzoquinol methylase